MVLLVEHEGMGQWLLTLGLLDVGKDVLEVSVDALRLLARLELLQPLADQLADLAQVRNQHRVHPLLIVIDISEEEGPELDFHRCVLQKRILRVHFAFMVVECLLVLVQHLDV
jgi:hypothetical protein